MTHAEQLNRWASAATLLLVWSSLASASSYWQQVHAPSAQPQMPSQLQRECTSYEQTVDVRLEIVTHCRNVDEVPLGTEILENTTYLLLDNNALGRVPSRFANQSRPEPGLARLHSLRFLDLSSNHLSYLGKETFAMNFYLEKLVLANNFFKRVPRESLTRLPRLKYVDMSGNRISILQNDSFIGLPGLLGLNLADNRISYIEIDTFSHLPNLQHLDLSLNNLTVIDEAVENSWSALRGLQLAGNPLHCDCNLLWLKTMIRTRGLAYDADALRCATSPVQTARNRTWSELSISHFACPPQLYHPPSGTITVVEVNEREKLTSLTCQMWSNPKQIVFWKRENKDVTHGISQDERKYEISISPFANFSTTLHIKWANQSDTGTYTCELANEAGAIRGQFLLQVLHEAQSDALTELIGPRGAGFTTLVVSVLGALLVILIVTSTVVYCWHFSRSSHAEQSKQPGCKSSKTGCSSPLALSLAPSYEPVKAAEPPPPPTVGATYRQVKFEEPANLLDAQNARMYEPQMSVECAEARLMDEYRTATLDFQKPCPVHGILPGTLTTSPRVRLPICVPSISSHSDYLMLSSSSPIPDSQASPVTHQRLALIVKPRHDASEVSTGTGTGTGTSLVDSPWSTRMEDLGSDTQMTLQNGYIAL